MLQVRYFVCESGRAPCETGVCEDDAMKMMVHMRAASSQDGRECGRAQGRKKIYVQIERMKKRDGAAHRVRGDCAGFGEYEDDHAKA
jgi:hypothetical protein